MLLILRHNLKQLLIAVDQLLNVLVCMVVLPGEMSYADETFSARCWRWHLNGVDWPYRIVDFLARCFGDVDHCCQSYESERCGRQLPPELR